ncbi:MAG TPA: metallophosphoesterase [Candidatus Limnocylindrales bacterium]|nr:metallophosphoesterase [Candidatus Limnocylindrales bacterium]
MNKNPFRKLQRLFWRYFFRLVVFTGAIAEWVCMAWVLIMILRLHVPWPIHVLGPVGLHMLNRRILGSRPGPAGARSSPFVRAYVGVVFTSLFGLVVLLANGAVWALIAAALGIASSLGSPVAAADVAGAAGMTGSVALVVVSSLIAWGYGPGQRRVHVLELDVVMPGLAPEFDGYQIAQLSDIHLGGYMTVDALASHVERTNSLSPDLTVVTGDITDGLDHVMETFPVLGGLRARDGVVAILGNHDVYTGADDVTAALRRLTPFRVLRDESIVIERGGHRLNVLGLNDAGLDWTRGVREHPALPRLAERVPAGEPVVLLSHRPDLFGQAAALGIGLVLSGHTHGGQLALPWPSSRPSSLAHFISDFPRGTYQLGNSTLHVNLGLGVTGQPVRVFSPREITLITLRSPAAAAEA